MIFVPAYAVALITFPGAVVRQVTQQLSCRLMRVAILRATYGGGTDGPGGHLIHEKPRRLYQQFLIAFSPLVFNVLAGAIVAFPAILPVLQFDTFGPLDILLVWLGWSIVMHAFPSMDEARALRAAVKSGRIGLFQKVVWQPVAMALTVAAAIREMFLVNVFISFAVISVAPALVLYW